MKQLCRMRVKRRLLASADTPAAEEARVAAEEMGCSVIYESMWAWPEFTGSFLAWRG